MYSILTIPKKPEFYPVFNQFLNPHLKAINHSYFNRKGVKKWGTTYANISGNIAVSSTVDGVDVSALPAALDLKANLASPTFTGTVTAGNITASGNISATGNVITSNATSSNQAVALGQFDCLKNENGYTKLPNGLIMQWGVASDWFDVPGGLSSANFYSVTFPISFPNQVLTITSGILYFDQTNNGSGLSSQVRVINNSTAEISLQEWGANIQKVKWKYIAIGY